MKAFQFNLRAVETVRQRLEQQALETYAAALQERSRALDALRESELALAAAQLELERSSSEGCRAFELASQSGHCHNLALRQNECAARLAHMDRKAEACLQQLLRVRRDRRAVEKLRFKQKALHALACSREEQKFLDELAQRRSENLFQPVAAGQSL